jgi:hypothetical protein
VNVLRQGGDDLVQLDYSDLLTKILELLRNPENKNPFNISGDRQRLLIDIDEPANQVVSSLPNSPLVGTFAKAATVNFTSGFRDIFPDKIREIKTRIKKLLETALAQLQPRVTAEQYLPELVTDLSDFKAKGTTNRLGFNYPFGEYTGLQKQRLTFQRSKNGSPLLKFHKLTITVRNVGNFDTQLREGLEKYINVEFDGESESDLEELRDKLEELVKEQKSDFYKLMRVVKTETLGKIQKEAKIRYLEYLLEHIGAADDAIYLENLIRRLRLINAYISDVNKADGDYDVNYAGRSESVNYKNLFSRADAFDMLPIIPLVVGYLGETKDEDRGEQQFVFGLKLKLNGKAQAHGGRPAFDHYMNLLDPDSKEHKEQLADASKSEFFKEKVLKIAFLYFFVFASRCDPLAADYNPNSELEYDPISVFENKVLPILRGSDEAAKQELLRNIKKGFDKFNVKEKINRLKQLLKKPLQQKTHFVRRDYSLHICVNQSILERDIDGIFNNLTFFKSVFGERTKEYLKYITISEPSVDENSLCQLPASITIEDIHYFPAEENQQFSMEYDIEGIKALPVLFVPKDDSCRRIYEEFFSQQKLVVFPYDHQRLKSDSLDSQQAFIYRFTFSLLSYICLNVLLYAKEKLFIPIVRLHLGDQQEPSLTEEFIRSFSKTLSHLLQEEHRSSSQGFRINDIAAALATYNKYKHQPKNSNQSFKLSGASLFRAQNGLSSLYSVLPKKFNFNNSLDSTKLEKLAIIVVSSRESDIKKRGADNKISNLMGEVIGVERLTDGTIRLETLNTFSANYEQQQLYRNPRVALDQVDNLYQLGYKDFFYIAKAPYSSTLHMTQTEEDRELYFMSRDIIQSLRGDRRNIKIYPVFFDKYYVLKIDKLTVNSLYIQDTMELTNLMEDPSQQVVVFFNLFNGITVSGEDRFYNGVISYATLLNIYQGILDDQEIRRGLIDDRGSDGESNSLKNDILQYLTLFHFSRYEKDKGISLKLDPYENIIGDDSVGKLSVFQHMRTSVNFNSLAFLTEVRGALNVNYEGRQ